MRRGSLDRALKLWSEGYTLTHIATQLHVGRSALLDHVTRGTLVLPERPWVRAIEAGVDDGQARRWHRAGFVRRSPSGLYDRDELARVKRELSSRICRHPGCDEPLTGTHTNYKFCAKHRRVGVDRERLLAVIRESPGILRHRIMYLVRRPNAVLQAELAELESQGLIVSRRLPGSGSPIGYWPID